MTSSSWTTRVMTCKKRIRHCQLFCHRRPDVAEDGETLPPTVTLNVEHADAVVASSRDTATSQTVRPVLMRLARGRLRHLGDGASVVVVGGGATGVETASEVAANHPNASVTLVSRGPILGALPDSSRRVISRGLTRLGVSVVEDDTVDVVDTSRVVLRSGTALPADLVLWAAALSVPDLARDSGLAVDATGRLEVDSTLRSISSGRIFGAGDAVHVLGPAGAHLRMSCAAAIPLGGHAANSVLAEIRGQVRPDLNVGYLLQCYSLGRNNGLIQFVNAADEPRALHLSGRLAAEIKESICTLVVTGPTREGVKPNSYWAPKGPRLARASR